MNTDDSKRRRRGPIPLDTADKREHTVSVRLNVDELARLDQLRCHVAMQRGEYLRAAALHRLPPTIPAINREAWAELARSAANLNQIAHHLNVGGSLDFEVVRATIDAFRRSLLGMNNHETGGDDDEKGT